MKTDGAGVDVLGSMRNFWIEALPAIKRSWVVIPTGRTSWVSSKVFLGDILNAQITQGHGLAWT